MARIVVALGLLVALLPVCVSFGDRGPSVPFALQDATDPVDFSKPDDSTPDAQIEAVLDALHRAAATADAETYFSLFAPRAVFLGTDATERWSIEEFRAFALPYFEGDEAWTYHPRSRWIEVFPGYETAVFDELLDQEKYGECRGSGTLRLIDGQWKIVRYHLTFPVPNEIAGAVTRWIQERETGTRWVFLVRHAEKESEGDDAGLTEVGRARAERLVGILDGVPLSVCISSEYRRTRDTVAPTATAKGLEVETVPARDGKALLEKLNALPAGSAALIAGHSNTVPAMLRALGIEEKVEIGHDDYGTLFAVRRGPGGPELLRLGF